MHGQNFTIPKKSIAATCLQSGTSTTCLLYTSPVTTMVGNLMEVPLMNAAKQGDVKKYNRLVWFQAIRCV